MSDLYIGLMSGTSADGIDAAVVDFSNNQVKLVATHYTPYHHELKSAILALAQPGQDEINRLGHLDAMLGQAFADATHQLLKTAELTPKHIQAIGSHGQTIRHLPRVFSLQIGDPNTIAAKTGITTIADFRRKDIALGGQGAPLVPAFHREVLGCNKKNRAVVNIGGMANVSLLPADQTHVMGFDTGPGNVLLDAWIYQHQQQTHDENGHWGKQGVVNTDLLSHLLTDPYFHQPAPKSTGREYFNLAWLNAALSHNITPVDVQATLTHLTAQSIIDAIQVHFSEGDILVCGGGAYNAFLMETLRQLAAPHFSVTTTDAHGIPANWMEAMAFAWLAKQTLNQHTGNLPSVTGATRPTVLGGVYTSL
jgi:anhydro-N-acetylmuramic acid kinase